MLTDCPSCTRSYQINRAALGPVGRAVICPLCDTRWFVAVGDADVPDEDPRADAAMSALVAWRQPVARARPVLRGVSAIAAGVAVLIGMTALIGGRVAVAKAIPRSAALYARLGMPVNVRGLDLNDVAVVRSEGGPPHFAVSGRIHNIARARTVVPRLAFELRGAAGVVLASWTENAPKSQLSKGETVAFLIDAPMLPEGSRDVMVRFAEGDGERLLTPGDKTSR